MSFKKMNPKVKELWVSALRSGKYQQTKGTLHDDVGYCCMGVLCDISPFPEQITSTGFSYWGRMTSQRGSSDATGVLSFEVREWAGLDDDYNPDIGFDPSSESEVKIPASYANDVLELSFNKIADMIEENL